MGWINFIIIDFHWFTLFQDIHCVFGLQWKYLFNTVNNKINAKYTQFGVGWLR